jgi:arylsulfatase
MKNPQRTLYGASLSLLAACSTAGMNSLAAETATAAKAKPNIIYILGDDLGIGELGCYGQTKIRTPNIDKLAKEGMLFTRHYAGSTVCAPSRCALLTGKHTGHAFIRTNAEVGTWDSYEGQMPIPANSDTIAKRLKSAGYATACIGKWGLGGVNSAGDPLNQGFDHFFGYNCQRHAHNYYPQYLIKDREKFPLNNPVIPQSAFPKDKDPNDPANYKCYQGTDYTPDFMEKEALSFIRDNKNKPFFLYFSTTVPHAALQVPDDSLAEYKDKFDDKPYLGDKGYLPNRYPRATYAAMITRMDRSVGRMMDELKELGLEKNTIICVVGDNGPTFNGGTDSEYFNSSRGDRGLKCAVYEGGIRAPLVVRWPAQIAAGSTSDHLSAMWDMLPTFCDAAGVEAPQNIDGISMLPTLLGKVQEQKQHEYLYWEDACNKRALRCGDWKMIKYHPSLKVELYNLKDDPQEKNDLSKSNPEMKNKLEKMMDEVRTDSKEFPLATKKPVQKKAK